MRTYQRKRPQQRADKDKRMELAVRLRAEGLSLRQIGAELNVSYMTVSRDLDRWDEMQPAGDSGNVVSLSRKLSHRAVTNCPATGRVVTGDRDTRSVTGDVLGLSVREERIARAVAYLTGRGA